MGLNIGIYRIEDTENLHSARSAGDGWWDSLRHTGDREFAAANLFHTIGCTQMYCCGDHYARPRDFGATREWIRKNIEPKENQQRLIDAVNKMEQDDYLWFYWGY